MMFTLAPLLVHSYEVPPAAREALRAALFGPAELRGAELERAAGILFRHTDLDCGEVRDLVGLPTSVHCV
jgi:hypothetical protein